MLARRTTCGDVSCWPSFLTRSTVVPAASRSLGPPCNPPLQFGLRPSPPHSFAAMATSSASSASTSNQETQTPQINSLLVLYPLEPRNLVDKLRANIPNVHFYPQRSAVDYNSTAGPAPVPSAEILANIDAILCFHLYPDLFDGDFLTMTPKLKLIQTEHPLTLANTAGIHATTIGEHALMVTLMLLHKILKVDRVIRKEKKWVGPNELGGRGPDAQLFFTELRGKTFAILGYGHIAREVARLASAFGANIIVATRSIPSEWYTTTSRSSLHSLLNRADIVLNLLPSSADTRGIMGRNEFEQMKDYAIYLNLGRGDTNDQDALAEALKASLEAEDEPMGQTGSLRIAGASIDVSNPEPLPDGHVFLGGLDNMILTPHSCWMSKLNFVRAVDVFLTNAERMNQGLGAINALRGKGE
ncbi:BZ3500_MvSof-1268-A1-R1_Chr5-2g07862 [Microbotryum saponariae]|uniref:BZ3500_MvSof-1268-A1-R1_Chr5-2g07862 protein n=1 Tax=Microbotryum saponariae TaxID=289078 RepID=A0A2X0MJL8_9BASI|nr:BZ3500_MvSof-1268-A1-R1_Chr5-2g07862 [Microbotryum saponariae]SDA05731.1 BZ3501_MvSof-1269-A2-R1_Chr5-2g07684 [Microbotryum saponariae]